MLDFIKNIFLSDTPQSMPLEALFWAILYTIYANVVSRILRRNYRKLPFWLLAKKREGVFCGNGQDDCILLLIMAIHHGSAGLLMALGTIYKDPILWRHGLLLEAGFEVADLLAAVFNMYPFRLDGIKPEIRVGQIFHHLPGITLSYFILSSGLQANPHMRAIGMWMLLGAAVSCFTGCYQYTLDFDKQMTRVAIVFIANVSFFFYCRFYEFPKESWLLIQDLKANPDVVDGLVLKLLYAGFVLMTLFNVLIAADVIPKVGRYIQRARDGVTPIETKAVPRSRDSVLGYRRLSLIMNQATVVSTNVDTRGSICQEDMSALKATISTMNGKKID